MSMDYQVITTSEISQIKDRFGKLADGHASPWKEAFRDVATAIGVLEQKAQQSGISQFESTTVKEA